MYMLRDAVNVGEVLKTSPIIFPRLNIALTKDREIRFFYIASVIPVHIDWLVDWLIVCSMRHWQRPIIKKLLLNNCFAQDWGCDRQTLK